MDREERLSKMVSSTIEGSLTNQKSKFLDTKNSLKDTKRRTQKRIVRGMYEREKAAERIADLQAKMDHEMNIINMELEEVLMEVQKKIDTEVSPILCGLVSICVSYHFMFCSFSISSFYF